MKPETLDHLIARWSRAGILFGQRPARTSPDPERLLLATARLIPQSPRLYQHVIAWLSQYDCFIARHRLKRLILDELEPAHRPALGLILDLAIEHGASRELNKAANECGQLTEPQPLFAIHQTSPLRRDLARRTASPTAIQRGLWAPEIELTLDALRPVNWIIQHNPSYRERAIRKGDLRCTILETLARDTPDQALPSELDLVRLCAANRPAVSAALNDLAREGITLRHADPEDGRRHRIELSDLVTSTT